MSQTSSAPATRSVWRRPRTWGAVALAAFGGWLLITVATTGFHAYQANKAINAMVDQIAAGDPQAAQSSIEQARSSSLAAQAGLDGLPLSVLRVVPYVDTNLTGADDFLTGALQVLDAAEVSNQLYATLSGADGSPGVFENGRIDIATLEGMAPQVRDISTRLDGAQGAIDQMPSDISPLLRRVQDKATEQIAGIQRGMRIYESLRPELPELLGADSPQTYLIVFNNPAELFAGGGASLSVALLEFDDGAMEVVDKGAVSSRFFPMNPRVAWDPVAGGPYYRDSGAKDGFAWSNLHQDFRVAGEDMMRSWVANGGQPVDGVIALDPTAMAAALRATGPIQTPLYGELNADNLIQKLFYEGYNEDPAAQAQRHQINEQLVSEMLTRMQDGSTALTIGRAMFSTAPGQHVRIHLSEGRLEDALRQAQADGAQPDPQPDRIAFYTQNQNASKVDIFQTRQLVHDVTLAEDGSATVTQTATVTNNAPAEGGSPLTDRIGYTTRWAFHWNIAFFPEGAEDLRIEANPGDITRDDRVFTDVDGRQAVRIGRWMAPGESSIITVTYRLPAGTFGTAGNLTYRAGVEHQLLVNDTALSVNVSGPSQPTPLEGVWTVDGNTASTQFALTEPTTIAVRFGQGA